MVAYNQNSDIIYWSEMYRIISEGLPAVSHTNVSQAEDERCTCQIQMVCSRILIRE